MTTPSSADLADLLTTTSRALRRRWRTLLEPFDVAPHHARALRLIARGDGVRPGAIAEALRITPRSASDVVDVLEARGLVTRRPDVHDRRAVVVEATADGTALATQIDAARRRAGSSFFQPLAVDERRQLAALLTQLLEREPRSSGPV